MVRVEKGIRKNHKSDALVVKLFIKKEVSAKTTDSGTSISIKEKERYSKDRRGQERVKLVSKMGLS